jgi:radical SAM protein with 4Fe4S-binding SPASM domain
MSPYIDDQTLLHAPSFSVTRVPGAIVAIDPTAPNWVLSDDRGGRLLGQFDGRTPFGQVVRDYAGFTGLDTARAWLHVETFARELLRQGFLSTHGVAAEPYLGRQAYLEVDRLHELWVQVNDFCNLACEHCLVSSSPAREQGLETGAIVDAIDQAVALGVDRVFFTGGEPLARPEIFKLGRRVVETHGRELVILTNGTLLRGERLEQLVDLASRAALGPTRHLVAPALNLQISLDGSSPDINDPIRGTGSFQGIVEGVKAAIAAGLRTTLTTTILRQNLVDLESIVRLACDLGVRNIHLLWPHRRGRILTGPFADLPPVNEILDAVRKARRVARGLDVSIDNLEEFRLRLDGTPGVKNDLAGAGWDSLCLHTDGCVYPSASMAGVPELRCGDLSKQSLKDVWKQSVICRDLRAATVEKKPICGDCSLKFLCGGGDWEHGYWTSATVGSGQRGSFVAHDPYCDLYKGLANDALIELAEAGRATIQARSGFDRPVVLRGMGETTLHDEAVLVRTTHSSCVLSEEVMEKSRLTVRTFYGDAAKEPKAELCCPVQPDAADLAHIPSEAVERFYGCGSPVSAAAVVNGETIVDLGSGAGIDCFIAAKKVGATGRVVGIDMTDQMLSVAEDCKPKVAAALGYDVVEFRKGYLEQIPLEDATADVVTSNCVINLSPDKRRVLCEIWRVLKNHGRTVIADIVSDCKVPPKMRADGQLWGECVSGALTEEAFLAALERSGFYGVSILTKSFWRKVEGYTFYAITVRGYKFEKQTSSQHVGQYAIYLGPQKAVVDEEGHFFPRGTPVKVCTDTASKLSNAPYASAFCVVGGPTGAGVVTDVDDGECGPGCC